ncbi:MAG: hypothetical protein ACK41F_07995 [Fimbriimonadaceae bacterium]
MAGRELDRKASEAIAGLLGADRRSVRARVHADALLGPLHGRFALLEARADRFALESMPVAGEPWPGRVWTLARMEVEFRNFRLGKLDVRGFRAEIPEVRFQIGPRSEPSFRFLGSREGIGAVWTDAESIARYAERRFPALRRLRVSFRGDLVVLEGEATLLWRTSEFWLAGRPVVAGPRRLGVAPRRVLFGGARAEGAALQAWSELLSALIDLDRDLGLNGSMDAREATVHPDRIEVRGAVRIPTRVQSDVPSGVF